MSEINVNQVVDNLLNGKKPSNNLIKNKEYLKEVTDELLNRIHNKTAAPSKCAHAMCLSSANGYSEVVQMLSLCPKSNFNKAYTFEEPLARAIRSWIKAKNNNDVELKLRCEQSAKYLILAGANIHTPEKYLKTKLSPAQRLQNDGSSEALELLTELTSGHNISIDDIPKKTKKVNNNSNNNNHDHDRDNNPQKKRKRSTES